MFTTPMELTVSTANRADLERVVRATSTPAGIARRARYILLLANGHSYRAVCVALGVTDRFVARWKRRFAEAASWRSRTPPAPAARITD